MGSISRQDAIEILKANYPDACFEQLREAVDVAIEALKAQDAVGDTISRQAAIDAYDYLVGGKPRRAFTEILRKLPSVQPEGWMEKNKERILQAGMEGREVEFRIGGRLFAIREKAQ